MAKTVLLFDAVNSAVVRIRLEDSIAADLVSRGVAAYPVTLPGPATSNPSPTPSLGLSLSSATIDTSAAAGLALTTITGVPAGVTPTLTPADGRFVISGDATNGWKVARGTSAVSAGNVSLTIAAAGVLSVTFAVTIAAISAPAVTLHPFAGQSNMQGLGTLSSNTQGAVSASTTTGSSQLVVGSVTSGNFYAGMTISGAGIPAGTTLLRGPQNGGVGVYTMSAAATATGSGVTVNGGSSAVNPGHWTGADARIQIWTPSGFATFAPFSNSGGSGDSTLWGPLFEYAYQWLADNPGKTFYAVQYAVGSTGLAADSSQLNWAQDGSTNATLWPNLVSTVNAAKAALVAAGKSVDMAKLKWMQGEQDAKDATKAGNYQANLQALLGNVTAQLGCPGMVIGRLHVEMTSTGFPYWSTIYGAQNAFAAANNNVEIVSTDYSITMGDSLHLTPAMLDQLGYRMYQAEAKWWAKGIYATLGFGVDANNDQCFIWTTPGDLATRKSCQLSDIVALTVTSTTQRTYIARDGSVRNDRAANQPRWTWANGKLQLLVEGQQQNAVTYSNDLSQSAWVKTNATATFDQTGPQALTTGAYPGSNASRITATAADATVLLSLTTSSASRVLSAYVQRVIGTGVVQMTQDGGTTWTDIAIGAGWARVTVAAQTLTNVTVGFRVRTSGDAINVTLVQSETGSVTSPIITAGNAVTRASEAYAFTSAAQAALTGAAASYFQRGVGQLLASATFLSADATSGDLLSRSSGGSVQARVGGTVAVAQAPGSGNLAGPWGIAGGFDGTPTIKVALNGALNTAAVAVEAHTAPVPFANSARSPTSFINCPLDSFGAGPTLLSDAALLTMAVPA